MKVCWLSTAEKNKDDLIDYIYQESGDIKLAFSVGDSIDSHANHLKDNPKLGKPGRRNNTREWVHPMYGYIVVYQLNTRIEILNIFRGQQLEEAPK